MMDSNLSDTSNSTGGKSPHTEQATGEAGSKCKDRDDEESGTCTATGASNEDHHAVPTSPARHASDPASGGGGGGGGNSPERADGGRGSGSGSGSGSGRDAYTAELYQARTQRNLMSGFQSNSLGGGQQADRDVQIRTLASFARYLSERDMEQGDSSSDDGYEDEGDDEVGDLRGIDHTGHSQVSGRRKNIHRKSAGVLQSSDIMSVLHMLGHSATSLEAGDGGGGHHDHHGHGHHHDHHHGGGRIPFYAYPVQRQRWGDDQVLPHINWGDLFFDLFYVAAAYNLGTLLSSAMTPTLWPRAIVYFIGIFGPLYNMWESKLVYEARYSVGDYAHQMLEIVRVFLLSFAVLHIKSIDLMSDPKSAEMFGFTLGIFLESLIHILLKVELICVGRGDLEALRNHSYRKIWVNFLPQSLFYLAATIIAGVQFWQESHPADGSGEKRFLAAENDSYGTQDGDDGWKLADLPIIICLASYVVNLLAEVFQKTFIAPKAEDFRKYNVPSNIDFSIHRYGEWTMLMLGEAVLSLLIVDTTESFDYYTVAILGTLTVILLQTVKFESEPSDAEGHALWRNMTVGMVYSVLIQVLSMGLIAFGVSYKIMLKIIHKEGEKKEGAGEYGYGQSNYEYGSGEDGKDGYGQESGYADAYGNVTDYDKETDGYSSYPGDGHRFLAPKVSVTDKAAAALFCGSLTIVLIALEFMANSHGGARLHLKHLLTDGGKLVSFVFKVSLILFIATLSQWLTDPTRIAVAGFFVVGAIATTKILPPCTKCWTERK